MNRSDDVHAGYHPSECRKSLRIGISNVAIIEAGLIAGDEVAHANYAAGLRYTVAGSVGVALGPGPAGAAPDMAAEALMRRADAALYAAKRTGRNRVTVSLSAA